MSRSLGALPRWTQGRGVDPPGTRTKIRECRNRARGALGMLRLEVASADRLARLGKAALANEALAQAQGWAARAAEARAEMKRWIRFRRSGEFR